MRNVPKLDVDLWYANVLGKAARIEVRRAQQIANRLMARPDNSGTCRTAHGATKKPDRQL